MSQSGGDASCFLRVHGITLTSGPLVLRPLTEEDWPVLAKWGRDPDDRPLTRFGFDPENADAIYGLVDGHNPRSRRAFEKNGYVLEHEEPHLPGGKTAAEWQLVLTRERWRSGSGGEQ